MTRYIPYCGSENRAWQLSVLSLMESGNVSGYVQCIPHTKTEQQSALLNFNEVNR